jgi:N-acetylneuraminate lyase
MKRLSGILPALITPFDSTGQINLSACEQLLDRLYGTGVHGVYICGTTGEGILQNLAQRKQVAEAVVKSSPDDKLVIVHVGAACLTDAVELAKHATKIGADAISSLPPPGLPFEEISSYYRVLASHAPLLLYFIPALSQSFTTASQILELCELPNVIGLKFTDHDLYKLWIVKQSGAIVFNGYDEVLGAGLLMGADGGIGTFYNLVPQLFMKLYAQSSAGQWDEARRTQSHINELITISLNFPLLAAVKTMLHWSGIDCGSVLPPRRMLTSEEINNLRHLLEHSRFAGAPFARPGE